MFDCSFSFFFLGTPILLLTFVSLRGVDYLPELSRRGFVSLPYLISPILARPFLDTIKTAGAPACSAGEWGGVPSVPELSSSVLNRCFYACILMFSHFSCILHSSFCLGLASPVCSCIFPEFARYFVPFLVFHDLFHYILPGSFHCFPRQFSSRKGTGLSGRFLSGLGEPTRLPGMTGSWVVGVPAARCQSWWDTLRHLWPEFLGERGHSVRRRIEEPFLTASGGGGWAASLPGSGCSHPLVGGGVALSLPLGASRFYGVKGSGRWVRGGLSPGAGAV